jgi:hypothetical protein
MERHMTKIELLERLNGVLKIGSAASGSIQEVRRVVRSLVEDIKLDGVLDVQQPPPKTRVDLMRKALHAAGITAEEIALMTAQDVVDMYKGMPR